MTPWCLACLGRRPPASLLWSLTQAWCGSGSHWTERYDPPRPPPQSFPREAGAEARGKWYIVFSPLSRIFLPEWCPSSRASAISRPSPASAVNNRPTMQESQETWVRSLGQEDPLENGMATHSSILPWRIPWSEESEELQSMGSQRVGHD